MSMLLFLELLLLVAGGKPSVIQQHLIAGKCCSKNERRHQVWIFQWTATAEGFCGGTLIHKNWVLTAGHCYNKNIARNVSVWAGIHPYRKFQIFNITSGDIHVYDETEKTGDIMLIKLPGAVSGITPAQLPASSCKTPAKGEKMQIAGHGSTVDQHGSPDRSKPLQCAVLKVSDCVHPRKNYFFGDGQTGKRIIYVSKGDSGGGWLKKKWKKDVIYGVLHGFFKDRTNCAVFTSVCSTPVRKWINHTMTKF